MSGFVDRRVDQAAAHEVAAAYLDAPGRHGEFAVWLSQERFHSPLARRALATELHGQHSVYWTTGEMAEPKAVLLDPGLLRRSRLLGAPPVASTSLSASPRGTPPPSRVATLLPEAVTTSCRSTPRRCSSNASTSSPTSGAS